MSASALLELVLDDGTFSPWDTIAVDVGPSLEYAAELERARSRTGVDESVITGEGRLRGRRIAVLVCEFGFLAGSIGVAAGERLVQAIERATREGLPVLGMPASGGTRMQEGTMAFLQMVKIAAAVAAHKAAQLPYLVYLRSPTTGGAFASWGSLGHLTFAEPRALIGFLGPRVYAALHDKAFPEGVQTAENLHTRGLVDAVLPPEQLGVVVDRALSILTARSYRPSAVGPRPEPDGVAARDVPAWDSVLASRRTDRPGVRQLLEIAAGDVVTLSGTGQGEVEPGMVLALARFDDVPCVVLGQDRRGQGVEHPLGPAALRMARRGMRLAGDLGLPLVTVIDTAGGALSRQAEEGGLAGEIARCLAEMAALQTPTVALLLGQGAGGAALALVPADRVLAAQHGWLSPLPPEGASAIVHHDIAHAGHMAAAQGVRSTDLAAAGLVDVIIGERCDAADEPVAFCRRVGRAVKRELAQLMVEDPGQRTARRLQRYRRIGL